ncbi:MAG: tripartite tricarboxylate transporter substrate binding protein [Betaproteobacteria bacterium]|nr:tripartite tricarboxylate transporter substrate binding protein [Betaproteobacteria bacterium]
MTPIRTCCCTAAVGIALAGCIATTIFAQSYPTKPIRLIVPSPPGGSTDIMARLVGQNLTHSLGQQVVVDNRSGASGLIGIQTVARSTPDGYTIMIATTNFITIPLLIAEATYSLGDFAPIVLAAHGPNLLVVRPSLPVKSVADLIALAKSQPGKLNYAAGASGATPHLAAELFKYMGKVNIVHIPYKGASAAVLGLIAEQVDIMFATAISVAPHIRSGRLKALAITSAQPSVLAPDLPTVAASGLPGYESGATSGFVAPARTPQPIVRRLNADMVNILQRADIRERLMRDGYEAMASTPQEYAEFLKRESAKWGKLIKEVNIRVQ